MTRARTDGWTDSGADRSRGAAGLTGVRFRDASSLAERAIALLEDAPRPHRELAREVFELRSVPRGVGDRLVNELLRNDVRASFDGSTGLWRRVGRPEPPAVPFRSIPFAVVDVETSGPPLGQGGRIVDIAVVRVEAGEILEVYSTLVDPGIPVTKFVERLTGISDRMLSRAPRFAAVCDEVRERLEGRVFVAHNVGFDWGFLGGEMRRARSLLPTGERLCTVHLTRRLLPGLKRRGLDSLAAYYGVSIEERHRARGDAVATAQVLLRLLSEAEKRQLVTWKDLTRFLGPRKGRRGEARSGQLDLQGWDEAGEAKGGKTC